MNIFLYTFINNITIIDMKKIEHIFEYHEYGYEELEDYAKELINYAREMRELAYSPYSNLKVGAAVLLENEKVIGGNNQENCAFPSGLCAERVAMFSARAQYPFSKVKAIAIISSNEDKIITPCGGCRQVMAEIIKEQDEDFDVIMASKKKVIVAKAGDLIPLVFNY